MDLENIFSYDERDFRVCLPKEESDSVFDHKLKSCWDEKMKQGCFRYSLEDIKTKHIPGQYGFIAQGNIKRATERRKPQFITNMIMPFQPDNFHFGKVDKKEILFQLMPKHWENEKSSRDMKLHGHTLIINVSPLEYCNSLLVPNLEKFYPQILNFTGVRIAIETVLLSWNPCLKVGMNSLGAYASVNHLHLHVYYLKETLYLQYAPVKQLMGDCFELENFPSEGFAFQLLEKEKVISTTESVMKLINFLQQEEIAHNIYITRGKAFLDSKVEDKDAFNAIRIFVWARKSSFGSKDDVGFNPALCELAGHLPIKNENYFKEVTEENVACILRDVCHDTYLKVKENVKHLYV